MKILWGLLLCLTLTSCVENSKKKEPTQETGNKGGQVIYLDANTPIEEVLEPIQLLEMINNRLDEPDCTNEDKTRLKQLKNSFDKNGNNLLLYGKIR